MRCDAPNLQPEHQSDDAALIGACRRLLALDVVVQAHNECDSNLDSEAFSLMHDDVETCH
jgi:hypothetical protein